MTAITLARRQARRLAIQAQLLAADRPVDLVATVHHLTLLQIDPTAAIAPNADLVSWSRLGDRYRPQSLRAALEADRSLFELDALIRPMSDLGLYLAEMATIPTTERTRAWLDANDRFRRDILSLLEASGPTLSRDISDTSQQPWASTGWTNDRNVTMMLELLARRGEVAIARRHGRQRLWDVAARVFPTDVTVVPRGEAMRIRNERRLRSLGIARAKTTKAPLEPWDVGDAGVPAVVDGVAGEWRIDPAGFEQLDAEGFAGRTALLSPFDRLVHDRGRAQELFGFDYVLEMYKPKAQRRWGYYALPILHGDRLIGKLDAKADRKTSTLEVYAIHEDVPFSKATATAVRKEVSRLAEWLGMEPNGI